jgi:hypothetical protein
MEYTMEELMKELVGKRCRIETTDGSIRTETIVSVKSQTIALDSETGACTVQYPVTLFFDYGEIDGAELRIIKSIEVYQDERG